MEKKEKEQAEKSLQLLKINYPNAKIILKYSDSWELLIAVCLSAQCTDVAVNKVTEKLFQKYKTVQDYANADISQLEQDIRSTGFYHNKAKSLKAAAKLVLEHFEGQVPKTMEELVKIPGVGRKTANIILGNAFHIVEGIAVDTHVRRLSQRLGFSNNDNPEKIEQDLMKLFDRSDWFQLTYLLIEHGRRVCVAKKPKCNECFLASLCPSAFKFPHFNQR